MQKDGSITVITSPNNTLDFKVLYKCGSPYQHNLCHILTCKLRQKCCSGPIHSRASIHQFLPIDKDLSVRNQVMNSSNPTISKITQELAEVMIVNVSRTVIKTFEPSIKFWIYGRIVENDGDRC